MRFLIAGFNRTPYEKQNRNSSIMEMMPISCSHVQHIVKSYSQPDRFETLNFM